MKRASNTRNTSRTTKSNSGNSDKKGSSQSASKSSKNGTTTRKAVSAKQATDNSEDLTKLVEDLLKDMYWAEKHLTKALPKMSKAADAPELQEAFDMHLQETEGQIERLEQVFEHFGLTVRAKKCEAMEGLVEEGKEVIENHDKGSVRDAALIIAAQKVEHYEIAAYGSLRTLAQVLGNDEAAQLLQETLDEEGETDKKLTEIALSINEIASEEGESEEDEEDSDDEEVEDVEMTEEDVDEEKSTTTKRR
jgi:ferritin-like metal-binding protein YciE